MSSASTLRRWISSVLDPLGTASPKSRRAAPLRRSLNIEPLEQRALLSVSINQDPMALMDSPISSALTDQQQAAAIQTLNTAPMAFVENVGQTADSNIRYVFQGVGANVLFSDAGPIFQAFPNESDTQAVVFRSTVVGARDVRPVGVNELPGRVSYLTGSDPDQWHADLSTYGTMAYVGIFDGVDLYLSGSSQSMKYEFHVAPNTTTDQIIVRYDGIEGLSIDEAGALHVNTAAGELVDAAPYIYQDIGGERVAVEGSYRLVDDFSYGFTVSGDYDPTAPLVIDPDLTWSTFLGGSSTDQIMSIAADASGNVYAAGYTRSTDFPTTPGAYKTSYSYQGDMELFVTKINASGSTLAYSTYVGGTSDDLAYGIAVDSSGNAYITGQTRSSNFPTTSGAYRTWLTGNDDVFVTKLNATGSGLLYSTYLGGTNGDFGRAIAVDSSGSAYVTGFTYSASGYYPFPTTAGCFDPYANDAGYGDAFVTKLTPTGNALSYSTFLGGSSIDYAYDIALWPNGSAIVTGATQSTDFPTTAGAYDTSHNGYFDVFVTMLLPSGNALNYSTFVGGAHADYGNSLTLDANYNVYVVGSTQSPNFPTTAGAVQTSNNGSRDTFALELYWRGDALAYSTYLGGSSDDYATGVAVDAYGRAYVTGNTNSPDFPMGTSQPYDYSFNGYNDAFVALLAPGAVQRQYVTYLGGASDDYGQSIAIDNSGNVFVGGNTNSSNFPTTPGAYDTSNNGDSFVSKLNFLSTAPTGLTIVPGNDTGVSHSDNITSNNNRAGDKVLAFFVNGTTPGATVTVYWNGTAIGWGPASSGTGTTVVCNTSVVVSDGLWNITARQTVPSRPQSVDSPPLAVTIDTTAPAAPNAPDLNAASDSGRYPNDNITNDTTPTLDLSGFDGYYRLFRNGVQIGGDYDSDGQFTEATPLADGVYSYTLYAIDAAGNLGPVSTALDITIDTVAEPGSWDTLGPTSAYYGGISETSDASYHPAVAIDADGRPVVAWQTYTPTGNNEIYVRRWNGSAWESLAGSGEGGGISNNTGSSQDPTVIVGNDGNPIVAWYDNTSGGYEIYVRRWDGAAWVEMAGSATGGGVSNNSGSSTVPTLTLDADGNPILAWQDSSNGPYAVYVKKWDGSAWIELGGSASGSGISDGSLWAGDPAITTDADGMPIVAWRDEAGGNAEIYVRRWDGLAWVEMAGSASGGGVSNTSGGSYLPAIVTDPSGMPTVVWYDFTPGHSEIYARRWDGSAWVELAGSGSGGGISNTPFDSRFPSVTINADGNPVVAWADGLSGNNEIYVRRWDGSAWADMSDGSAIRGGISRNSGSSSEPVLAGSSPVAVWTDNSSGLSQIYVRRWTPQRMSLGTESGVSSTDNITNNNMPFFDVQGYGDYYRVFRDGTQVTGDYVGGSQYWQVLPLDDGDHIFTIMVVDIAGNIVEPTLEVTVTIDTMAPAVPDALDLDASSDSGFSSTDNITSNNTLTFNLSGVESYYRVFRDGTQISGDYETGNQYTADAQPEGTWEYSVLAVDAAGNVSEPSDVLQVTIDTAAPARPSQPDLDTASDTGVFDTDNLTTDTTPTFNLSGYQYYYRLYRDDIQISDDYATAAQFDTVVPLGQGNYRYAMRAVDAAGNVSNESVSLYVGIDLTPPASPSMPDLDISSDSGISTTDNVTNDNTPLLNLAGFGTYYRLYRDGMQISGDYATASQFVEPSALSDGLYRYDLRAMDQAGNMSGPSASLSVFVDTQAPAIPNVPDLDTSSDSGYLADDNITNDATPLLNLSGFGTYYRLYRDGSQLSGDYATTTQFAEGAVLAQGTHAYTLKSADIAGNLSDPSANLYVMIDTEDPGLFATQAPLPNANGWNNSDVQVSYAAWDYLSGVFSVDSPTVISSEGEDQIATGYATDRAGNVGSVSTTASIDKTLPVTTATALGIAGGNGWYQSSVTVMLSANDNLAGIENTFYTVDGGPAQTYSTPFTVLGDLVHTVTYWSSDKAGNVETPNSLELKIDTTPPEVTLTPDRSADSNSWYNHPIAFTVDATDNLSGAATQTDDFTYSDPDADSASVSATATDEAGNVANVSYDFQYDATLPTVAMSGPSAPMTNSGPISYTITYDDAYFAASTLSAADITLIRTGTADGVVSVSGSDMLYTVTIDGITGDGTLAISITAGTASDQAGNMAPESGPSDSFSVDNTAPTVAISDPSALATKGGLVSYTVTIDDDNFDGSTLSASDVTLVTTGTATGDISVSGSGTSYTVSIENITGDGTLAIAIAANTAFDQAGNLAPDAGPSATFLVDNTAPTVTIEQAVGQLDTTNAPPIHFTVTFSEPVADFDAADVTLGGTATGTLTSIVTGSDAVYDVAVSGMTGQGTVVASIAAGTTHDAVGNANLASTSADNTVLYTTFSISSVLVVEATAGNGILESNDQIVITWAANGDNPVATQSLTVDGQAVATLYGPYASGTPGTSYSAGLFGPLAGGTHHYTIQTTDTKGNTATYSDSFEVKAMGLAVSSVVVAEATAGNGILESSEQLVITWAASGPNPVATKSLTVDGQAVATLYGPYASGTPGTSYCAGVFGPVAGGTHHYTIQVTDNKGNATTYDGTFEVKGTSFTISSVVVAEANAGNGALDSTEQLVVTWAVNGENPVATKSLTVDGQAASTLYGPYASGTAGTSYCAGVFGPIAGGTHHYTIQATDTKGNTATYNGSFEVKGTSFTISSTVVAEAQAPGNGTLESNEQLVITWAVNGENPLATESLTVDGQAASTLYGPYASGTAGTSYCAGVFGPIASGTHHYTIQATDTKGAVATFDGTFDVVAASALMLDADPSPQGNAPSLANAQLAAVVAEAERRLTAATGIQVASALAGVSIQVADLPGNRLGEAVDAVIRIDRDAAGRGWFLDPTPSDDLEFADILGRQTLSASTGSTVADRVDLLTAVMHEMGHVLGYEHSSSLDLMSPTLSLGERRVGRLGSD